MTDRTWIGVSNNNNSVCAAVNWSVAGVPHLAISCFCCKAQPP